MNIIKIKAIISDFDGTLVDSESLYTKSLIDTSNKMNVLENVDFESLAGLQTNYIVDFLREKGHYVPDNFFDETEKYFHEIIETQLQTFEGVAETFEKIKGIDIIIASNSNINYVKKFSEKTGISKYVKDYSCYNETLKPKPAPDLFLHAFELLQKNNDDLKKEEVCILEDSIVGIEAAKKSGIKCIAITNSYEREKLLDSGADIVVNKILEIFNYIEIIK